MIVKLSTAVRIPVRLLSAAGTAVLNIIPADVLSTQATIIKSDGTATQITLSGANFFEVDSVTAPGLYHILLTTTHTNTEGPTQLAVLPAAGAFVGIVASFQVQQALNYIDAAITSRASSADMGTALSSLTSISSTLGTVNTNVSAINTTVNTINTNVNTVSTNVNGLVTAVSDLTSDVADLTTTVDGLSSNVTDIASKVQDLHDIELGKWQIFTTGPDANRLVLYKPDGTTVIKKFDLKNADGVLTFVNPLSRTPAGSES